MNRDAPEKIYLNIIEDEPYSVANSTGEVTWCEDKQYDYDIEYTLSTLVEELCKEAYEDGYRAHQLESMPR